MSRYLEQKFGLTEKQAAFAVAFVQYGDVGLASERAGYSDATTGWQVLRVPHVVLAIREELQRRLITEGATIGLDALLKIAGNKREPAAARVAAAKALLDRAGFVPPSLKDEGTGKQLTEMSPDELRRFIEEAEKDINAAEAKLASRAIPVNASVIAPTPTVDDAQLQELLA